MQFAMESLPNTTKRKKRKTRKCLDEIRKRSRRTGQILFEKDNGKVCDSFSNYNTANNCFVTNNRLTLRMFPKAVRSETITRPALDDLKNKSNFNLDELVKGTKALSSTNVRMPELINTFDNSIEHLGNENFKISNKCALKESITFKQSDVQNMCHQEENNSDMFTSMDSAEVTDKSPHSLRALSVSTLTTSSNQSVHDDFGYNLYEEFMSKLPTYLKRNTTIIEEDVMKKTKVYLQNLFIDSCYQECEENVLKYKKGNTTNKDYTPPSEMIVHNPMDYIRLGHVQQQSLFHRTSSLRVTIDGGCSIPQSPLLAPSSPAASPDSPLNVIVNDTPSYTYYPHRLN